MANTSTLSQKSVRYLQKNYAYFKKDPSFFFMKTMARFELARTLRRRASSLPSAPPLPRLPPPSATPQVAADLAQAVPLLEREGYYVGLQLAPQTLAGLLSRAERETCFADRDQHMPFRIGELEDAERRYGRRIKLGSYFKQVETWPEFRAIRNEPMLQHIARQYLGCDPVYLRSDLMWSFPCWATEEERLANAQVFHCDINDFRTLKFFFYLTDVGFDSGPHEYIKKSSRARTLFHQLLGQRCASIPDGELEETYGRDQVVTITGAAGLGFVGDPYYFHRGTTPKSRARLLLQIEVGCKLYRTWYVDTP